MLETLGEIAWLLLGFVLGAGFMYGFEVFMDWKEDREEAKQQEGG